MADNFDLNNLAVALPEPEPEEKREPARKGSSGISIGSAAGWGFLIVVVLVLMSAMIYGKVRISALYTQRAELEAQLTQLQNDNVTLQAELSEKTNMNTVDEYAREQLGLTKLEKNQIEYVRIETPSVAEVKDQDSDGILERFKEWIGSFGEYLDS